MELPSFFQFAAFLKKKKSSPTSDKSKADTVSPTLVEDGSKVSMPIEPLNDTPRDENALAKSIVQNETLYPYMHDKECCNSLSLQVKKLEELLADKDALLAALQEQHATCKDFSVDISTGMLSFGMEADYVTHIERYQKRLEEFAEAVKERDSLIVQLSDKLKSSNEVRASLQSKEEHMLQDFALLQQQLQHTKEIIEGHVWDTGIKPVDFLALQSQLLTLENTVSKNKSVINGLNGALQQRDMVLQAQSEELDKKSQELSQHKTKSAKEIQELMREVEELNQRAVLSTSSDSHSHSLLLLRGQLEEEFGLQLVQFKEEFRNQLDEKEKALKEAQNMITVQQQQLVDKEETFKSELLSYKRQVEALNADRQAAAVVEDELSSELGSYNAELALQKELNQEMNVKLLNLTALNEKLTYELVTLQQCQHDELQAYDQQICDLKLRLHEGGDINKSRVDNAGQQHLNQQLLEQQEHFKKKMSQSRQSYVKELESLRQRNEALELELDNILQNGEKCTAELNACKEAYIAQWGSNKHAQDAEISSLKEEIGSLRLRLEEASTVRKRTEQLYSDIKTKEQDGEREALRHKVETLKQSLQEKSEVEECRQSELDRYREQVHQLEEKNATLKRELESVVAINDKEISGLLQDLQDSKSLLASLQEEKSKVGELLKQAVEDKEIVSKRLEMSTSKYSAEVLSYEEKLEVINSEVDNLTKGHVETLSSYHEAQSLNTSLEGRVKFLESELHASREQLKSVATKSQENFSKAKDDYERRVEEYKNQIETLKIEFKESALINDTYRMELEFWEQQIHEMTLLLSKESNSEVPNTELDSAKKSIHEQLVIRIKTNFRMLQHLFKAREDSFHSATSQLEDSTLRLLSAQSALGSKEMLEETLVDKDRRLDELATTVSAITEELANAKQQLKEREVLLETKTDMECTLHTRIENLEAEFLRVTQDLASMQERCQEATVKLVTAEALGAAKDELEVGLKSRVVELENTLHKVNEDSLSIRLESDRVTEKVAKAKDLLSRMRSENEELTTLCKLHEDGASQLREKLILSERRVENLLMEVNVLNKKLTGHEQTEEPFTVQHAHQLSSQVPGASSAHSGQETSQQKADLDGLTLQIQQFEKYQEELVMRCNLYEEEVGRLREQLLTSELSLESMKQEVSNNKCSRSLDTYGLSPLNTEESALNRRDLILSGGDSAPVNDYGCNVSGQVLNSTEYMGVEDFNTHNALKLIDNCSLLENVRNELIGNVQDLQTKLEEKELKEKLDQEGLKSLELRCKSFERRIVEMSKALEAAENRIISQNVLETKIRNLESEYNALQDLQANIRNELVTQRVAYEEKLNRQLHEQLVESLVIENNTSFEDLIMDQESKAKEVIVLSEKLRSKEQTELALTLRVKLLEESHESIVAQLGLLKDEASSVRKELEQAWQKQRQTEDELAHVSRELAITQLAKAQLERRWSRMKDRGVEENLESVKVAVLKQALQQQAPHSEPLGTADNDNSIQSFDALEDSIVTVRGKLQDIVQKNASLVAEGNEGWSAKLDDHETSLVAELSAYREQHATLAEILGSTGILQEALHRQKQELLQKTQEKTVIEQLMESERSKLQATTLQIQTLEHHMLQRDAVEQELSRQKHLLEQDLREIEERLRDREDVLLNQRASLEAEIRARDLSIRHWQLQCRAQHVEQNTQQTVSRLTSPAPSSPSSMEQERLDRVRRDLDATHKKAMKRLKGHLVEQFSSNEAALVEKHAAELGTLHEEHRKQLATLQEQLQAKVAELEALTSVHKPDIDLDELKNSLDENEKEVYTRLRQEFEAYARQQVESALHRLQSEHELILSSQRTVHEQEMQALKRKLEQQKQTELLDTQQNLTKEQSREAVELEELQPAAETHYKPYPMDSKAAMLLLKQLVCYEFTVSFKALTECRNDEYRKEMAELISQVEEAVLHDDQSRKDDVPVLLDTQEKLLTKTEELLTRVVAEHECMLEGLEAALDAGHKRLSHHLERASQEAETATTLAVLQGKVTGLEDERLQLIQQHRLSIELLTKNHNAEVTRLQELLSVSGIECGPCIYLRHELETKHTSEMEELRQYFEKKCSELEKHYSEEIFSQHSRKLSSSSSCESELASDIYYTGGDQGHRINTLTHMCDSFTVEPSYKDLEEHYQRDYEKRILEYREQLDAVKRDMEEKYCTEMESLKEEYDTKVEELVRDLATNHSAEIRDLENKHSKDMETLRAQLSAEARKDEANTKNKVERARLDLEESHSRHLEELQHEFREQLNRDMDNLADRMLRDEADHIRIVQEQLQEKHDREMKQLETDIGAEQSYKRQLEELEEKHKAQLEQERKSFAEHVDELTAVVKRGAEQEQETFMRTQKEMIQGLLSQHQQDMTALREQHEARLRAAQGEIRKLQDEHAEYSEHILQSKRRLHDEVQHDVLQALEGQLKVLLSEDADEKSWPAELLQLRTKVAAQYQEELTTLKQEVDTLRKELERVQSVKGGPTAGGSCSEGANNKESVGMKQMATTLKHVIGEIVQYMSVCEEELNNTLVNEILKYDWENSLADDSRGPNELTDPDSTGPNGLTDPSFFRDAPNESNLMTLPDDTSLVGNADLGRKEFTMYGNEPTSSRNVTLDESCSREPKVRRVHFAPDISSIFNMDEDSLVEYMDNNKDLSTEFRSELDTCLGRLKAEAAALMGLSASVPKQTAAMEERLAALSRQLASEIKTKEELSTQLDGMQIYKDGADQIRQRLDAVSAELRVAQARISELESREDVTEGYGEQVLHNSMREGLAQLQDQGTEGGVKSPHLQMIEELIREGDRLMEESKQEKDDLKQQVSFETSLSIAHRPCCQQIATADKQLRSTRQFLEEQAAERELERDEFLQEIARLQEQLKVTDKDRTTNHRRAKEAECLEAQMKEATGSLQEAETRKEELEAELKTAIEKVWVLRDIITELESQVEIKTRHEAALRKQLEELEAVLEQQNKTNQDLMQQLDRGNGELTEHVAHLEEQLSLHRQHMELLQPDSLQVKQMKTQLREFETTLDKKTKDLESLYVTTLSNTSCSSPSEDVSFRDHMDVMRCATPDETLVSLPFDQLGRVQEKLHAHSRAEQAALKKIRDLEMQVKALQRNEEEVMAERDALQNQVDEQLLKISSIKAHLDEQRTKADQLVKIASCDLEARLHQREMEIRDLKEAVENKDKQVAVARTLLEDTRQAVSTQEVEWSSRVAKQQALVQTLKRECKQLMEEKKARHQEDGAMGQYVPIPILIDTMLATKNAELDELSRKVDELEDKLRAYMNLDLTPEQRQKLDNMLEEVEAKQKEIKRARSQPTSKTSSRIASPDRMRDGESVLGEEEAGPSGVVRGSSVLGEEETGPSGVVRGSADLKLTEEDRVQRRSAEADGGERISADGISRSSTMAGRERSYASGSTESAQKSAEVLYEREKRSTRLDDDPSSGAESDMDDNELRQLLLRKESQIISLRNQLAGQMTESLTDLQKDLDAKDQRIAELEAQLADLPNLEREIKSLRDQLQEAIKDVAQDREELKQQTSSQMKVKNEMEEREAALQEKQKDLESREKSLSLVDVDALLSELESERRSTKSLKDEVNSLRAENDRLQSELDALLLKSDGVADRLAGQVQKELDISADLDQKMIDRLDNMATRDVDGLACSPGLAQILHKILKHGMDALLFEELSQLHQRCCEATSAMIMQNTTGRLPLEMIPTSLSTGQQSGDKDVLCRRIMALEGEIKHRQDEATKNVRRMEAKLHSEEKRLRQLLVGEQQRNLDLHDRLGNQNQLESERDVLLRQSSYQEERIQQLMSSLDREKKKALHLEDNLQKEKITSRHLQSLLETERFRGRNANIQESNVIETMRSKLDNAMDNEGKMRIRMEKMESNICQAQQPPCAAPCNPPHHQYPDMQDFLDAKNETCARLEQSLKREKLQVEQLRVQLDRERQQALERVGSERETRETLLRQISALEKDKESLGLQLDTARESLGSLRLVSESLERKLSATQEVDIRRQRRREEDDERNKHMLEKQRAIQFDLEQKVLVLQQEVSNLRDQTSACGDQVQLRQQLSDSLQREQQLIRDLMAKYPQEGLSAPLLQKLKSMNTLLEKHVEENANVAAAMTQISLERQRLQDRVRTLEAQLARQNSTRNVENETEIVNGILAAERTTWAREKAGLDHALLQSESRASRAVSESNAKEEHTRHLFGKYLRVESYRKALIWQKRYLLVVLSGYQDAEAKTVDRLSRIARANEAAIEGLVNEPTLGPREPVPNSSRQRATNKFKSCCLAVVAVHRMHYMVRRWRHSRLLGSNVLFNRGSTESIPSSTQSSYFNGPRRKGSTSSCWSVPRSLSHSDVPNIAHGPSSRYARVSSSPTTDHALSARGRYNVAMSPAREQHMTGRWQTERYQLQTRHSECVPDGSRSQVAEYISRLDHLQQALGLNVAHTGTGTPSSDKPQDASRS